MHSDHDALINQIPSLQVDRRRFLQYAASVTAIAGLDGNAFSQASQDTAAAQSASDARLPDGTEYRLLGTAAQIHQNLLRR